MRFSRVMSSSTSMQPIGLPAVSKSGAAVRLIAAALPSGSSIEHLIHRHSKNTLGRFIDLDDIQVLIERNDAIGQRLQNAFIVVLQRENIGEQLRVLDRDGDLGAKRLCPADVDRPESPAMLVEHLDDPETLARLVGDRDGQNVAGAKAGG